MDNFYEILGITTSATESEIRRAYRILARRYHPDLNPTEAASDKFKKISEGYRLLSDAGQRKKYDADLEIHRKKTTNGAFAAYEREQAKKDSATERYIRSQAKDYEKIRKMQEVNSQRRQVENSSLLEDAFHTTRTIFDTFKSNAKKIIHKKTAPQKNKSASPEQSHKVNSLAIIEVSITVYDSIVGVRKTVEIEEPEGVRKLRVGIPAGARNGSLIRMRSSQNQEELVIVVRLARHPFMSIDARGLIIEIPLTLEEAIKGASIKVPTLDEEQIMLKIPPGSQSGTELRVRSKGIKEKDGRGDLIYRVMIQIPENFENQSTGFLNSLAADYKNSIRSALPRTLLERVA